MVAADERDGYEVELAAAAAAAVAAGHVIREFYDRQSAATYTKSDGSPVTDADLASDRLIRARLHARFPNDRILTEEGSDDAVRLNADRCWIVDPLDGTAQFVARSGEFDVLIALVVAGRPVVGVAYQPVTGLLCAAARGQGAWIERAGERRPLHFTPLPVGEPARPATSTWFGGPATLPALGRVAARAAAAPPTMEIVGFQPRMYASSDPARRRSDAYIGLTTEPHQTMASEWDFAACDIIANEAGGVFTDLRGRPHRYHKPIPRNLGGLLVAADPATHARFLDAIRPELPREE